MDLLVWEFRGTHLNGAENVIFQESILYASTFAEKSWASADMVLLAGANV